MPSEEYHDKYQVEISWKAMVVDVSPAKIALGDSTTMVKTVKQQERIGLGKT